MMRTLFLSIWLLLCTAFYIGCDSFQLPVVKTVRKNGLFPIKSTMVSEAKVEQPIIMNHFLHKSPKSNKNENIVVLHGLLGSSRNLQSWSKLLFTKLGEQYPVYGFDLRNHGGRASHGSLPMTYDLMAKDLFYSLKNLGITNCHLIGHSVGAKVAARAATMCKEFEGTILSLTMMDLSPVQYSVDDFEEVLTCLQSLLEISHKTLSRKDVAKPEIFQMIESHFPDNTMCKFIQSSVVPTTEPDGTIRFDWSFNLEGILASFHHLLGFPEEDIPSYPVPLLLMKGSKSNYVKMIHLLHAVRYFPKHSIVAVRDASHWLHHDQPQQSSDVVAKFIKSPTTPV